MKKLPRRDRCAIVGARMVRLDRAQASMAWRILATAIMDLEHRDIPKFNDIIQAIRHATIQSKNEL